MSIKIKLGEVTKYDNIKNMCPMMVNNILKKSQSHNKRDGQTNTCQRYKRLNKDSQN